MASWLQEEQSLGAAFKSASVDKSIELCASVSPATCLHLGIMPLRSLHKVIQETEIKRVNVNSVFIPNENMKGLQSHLDTSGLGEWNTFFPGHKAGGLQDAPEKCLFRFCFTSQGGLLV